MLDGSLYQWSYDLSGYVQRDALASSNSGSLNAFLNILLANDAMRHILKLYTRTFSIGVAIYWQINNKKCVQIKGDPLSQ